ncbi:MAG: nitroreductase family deazaflavin-dependent oxidoreductase [Acidimicrobiales bacterium]
MKDRLIRPLLPLVVGVLAVGVVAGALLGAVFVVGMRRKSPGVQGAVRRMNKAFWNPRSMETAGRCGAYASVVHHVGRRSGTAHDTPVVPVETEDGFVIALPYGTHADWVRNVLAAGRATIDHEGRTYEVDRPEVVPTEEVDIHFAESERRTHRMFRVGECLRLHLVDATTGQNDGTADADAATISST